METTTLTHEAHGGCNECHGKVHRYPFGWAHVTTRVPCKSRPDPLAGNLHITCCDEHKSEVR